MISYEPLFKTMERKGISSYRLGKMGFPMTTYHSIKKGKTFPPRRSTRSASCSIAM